MSVVFCPKRSGRIEPMFARAARPRNIFREAPVEGSTHYYRSARDNEIPGFLKPKYNIGPHDERMTFCGEHNDEVFGWNIRDDQIVEIDSDDVFWDGANGIRPDQMDNWSKAKMIRKFPHVFEGKMPAHFGPCWAEMKELLSTDEDINVALEAEMALIKLRQFLDRHFSEKTITNMVNGSGFMSSIFSLNPYFTVPLLQYLDTSGIANVEKMCRMLMKKDSISPLLDIIRKKAFSQSFSNNMACNIVKDLMETAFIPLDSRGKPEMNLENFKSILEHLCNPGNFYWLDNRKIQVEGNDNIIWHLLYHSCRTWSEFDGEVDSFIIQNG